MDDALVDDNQLRHQLQIEIAQRLAAQERLQSSAAQLSAVSKALHDVNNQLLVIHFACRELLTQIPESDPRRSSLAAIELARNEAAAATKWLRSNGCVSPNSPSSDLNQIVRDATSLIKPILPDSTMLTITLTPKPTFVPVSADVIRQAITLLITNALLTIPQGGWIAVETFLSSPKPLCDQGNHDRKVICLQISDTGAVDRDLECAASDSNQNATNIPLIVKQLQHTLRNSLTGIHLAAKADEGSRITLRFPHPQDLARDDSPPPPHFDFTANPRTILLVDDEPQIRRMLRSHLEQHGFDVVEASDGDEAITLGLESHHQISLLLTDYHLPGASGVEIAKRLQSRYPQLPVLVMTGSGNLRSSLLESGLRFDLLTKPFQPNELIKQIHSLLETSMSSHAK